MKPPILGLFQFLPVHFFAEWSERAFHAECVSVVEPDVDGEGFASGRVIYLSVRPYSVFEGNFFYQNNFAGRRLPFCFVWIFRVCPDISLFVFLFFHPDDLRLITIDTGFGETHLGFVTVFFDPIYANYFVSCKGLGDGRHDHCEE